MLSCFFLALTNLLLHTRLLTNSCFVHCHVVITCFILSICVSIAYFEHSSFSTTNLKVRMQAVVYNKQIRYYFNALTNRKICVLFQKLQKLNFATESLNRLIILAFVGFLKLLICRHTFINKFKKPLILLKN